MKAFSIIALVLAAIPVAAPVTASAAPTDAAFVTDAMKGDNSEVSMGAMAMKRGASARTRSYGAMLVHDHGAHRTKLAAMAPSLRIHPTAALSDDGMKARTMLMGMHGGQFDAAFKQHMVQDHQQDIGKYENEAKSAQSPKVRAMAQETLPTLHKHLAAAQAL